MYKRILPILLILKFTFSTYGQKHLVDFKIECLEGIYYSDELIFEDRIVSQEIIGDTLKISVAKTEDCAFDNSIGEFLCKGDTLKLYYSQKRSESQFPLIAMCDCPFEIMYIIKGYSMLPRVILVNDSLTEFKPDRFKIFEVSFEILDGDTVNYRDKYGLRQRRWITVDEEMVDWRGKSEFVRFTYDYYYLNNEIQYGSRTAYDTDYKLHSILRINEDGSKDAFLYDTEGNILKHDKIE